MGLCCCCKDEDSLKGANETAVVMNDDNAIIAQPTKKSANSNCQFSSLAGNQTNGFLNDAVEFDEIDLNEKQLSVRSRDKSSPGSIDKHPLDNNNQPSKDESDTEEIVHLTSLMLDQFYENDKGNETVEPAEASDDQLSKEIVEDYEFDSNVVTEATDAEAQQALAKSLARGNYRLSIDLVDEPYCSENLLRDNVVNSDPIPAPRTTKSSTQILSSLSSASSSQQLSANNCEDEAICVHETTKCPYEFEMARLECLPSAAYEIAVSAGTSNSSGSACEDKESPYLPSNDQMTHEHIKESRMYDDFSTSSSSSSSHCDVSEFKKSEIKSTDRPQELKSYSVLLIEKTDKSSGG